MNDYIFFWLDDHDIFSYSPPNAASAWGLFDAILDTEHVFEAREGVVPREGIENEALQIAKRQRLVLTPDDPDVANLADLEGFLDPGELRACQMAQLLQQFHAIPAVAANRNEWEDMYT